MGDRAALLEDNRRMPVLLEGGRRQPERVFCLGASCDHLETHPRDVMAFIDDQLSVLGHAIVDFAPPDEALHEPISTCRDSLRLPAPRWPIEMLLVSRKVPSRAIH